jgi:hypothetical protein
VIGYQETDRREEFTDVPWYDQISHSLSVSNVSQIISKSGLRTWSSSRAGVDGKIENMQSLAWERTQEALITTVKWASFGLEPSLLHVLNKRFISSHASGNIGAVVNFGI